MKYSVKVKVVLLYLCTLSFASRFQILKKQTNKTKNPGFCSTKVFVDH